MKIPHLIVYFLVIALSACGNRQENEAATVDKMAAVADEQVSEIVMNAVPEAKKLKSASGNQLEILSAKNFNTEKKIIKDGSITVKSQDINASKKGFDNLLKQLNAYYETEDLQNNEQTTAYNLKIRIPASNFEKLITGIENGKDKIESKNIQTRDVTEEYVDTETRLGSKRDYLKRYKEILSKAATVKDILTVEENIRNLQEEIESTAGRLNYLKDQVAFSTLNITLYKQKEYLQQPQSGFLTRTKVALNNGWQSIVDCVLWMLSIWPYLIILFISYLTIKRIIKIRRQRIKPKETN